MIFVISGHNLFMQSLSNHAGIGSKMQDLVGDLRISFLTTKIITDKKLSTTDPAPDGSLVMDICLEHFWCLPVSDESYSQKLLQVCCQFRSITVNRTGIPSEGTHQVLAWSPWKGSRLTLGLFNFGCVIGLFRLMQQSLTPPQASQ